MICGTGDKQCAICALDVLCFEVTDVEQFELASETELVKRLNEGRHKNYRQLMIDTLKKHYNHEYIGYEELPLLPKRELCCTTTNNDRKGNKFMYNKIEITFKSGMTMVYSEEKWDDYSYDGKFFCIKKNQTCIAYYNCDDVFCVELKEKR